MEPDLTARRRWIGALTLFAAVAMIIGGETVLRDRLGPLSTLVYWLVCLALTGVAVYTALLDLRALRLRTRREERDLLEATVKKIQFEVEARPSEPGRARNGSGDRR
ncbi:MAG TPA: hypothetical protein VMU04_02600 [Candidatus Acidoferrum sp.]|nr:hypothetical protein [Candidatus Acidoferrum sp.]